MKGIYDIDEIKNILIPIFEGYPIYKVVLFGSYARGEADAISDLDIVVDSGGELRGFNFFRLLDDIVTATEKRVDLMEISGIHADSPIQTSLQNEGVLIYERTG
jgi:predicted nucleotidyltransferase